jgi:hypothetical protein
MRDDVGRGGDGEGQEEEEDIKAMVIEVLNTPWKEMLVYVLHPESVDTVEYLAYPLKGGGGGLLPPDNDGGVNACTTHRYKWQEGIPRQPVHDHGS